VNTPNRPNPPTAPQTIDELMAQALAIEREAVERYTELADMMEQHNNPEVAEMFRKMAQYEGHHVEQILRQMGWSKETAPRRHSANWGSFESPEAVPVDEVHYLMHPWHALQLALAAEQRAEAFFAGLVRDAPTDAIRRAAEEMRLEEAEHVELVQEWLAKVPKPEADWSVDPDPPRYID
jgi:rubrerythrin